MTIAVFADIHGNSIALQQCLTHALQCGADTFFFLGDYLGELAYPQRTMKLIDSIQAQYPCFFIRGNKEDYWIDHEKNPTGWKEFDSTTGCMYYTYHNLKQEDLCFFKSLPLRRQISFDGLPLLTVCHGSPRRVNEKMQANDENTLLLMEQDPASYILCGHTHIQNRFESHGKTVLNPGSVGVPLRSGGKAQYMLLRESSGKWEYTFFSLKYDVEAVIADLHASGLYERAPYWCKITEHTLRTGEDSANTVLKKAMEICRQRFGACHWPEIPDSCWEQACSELFSGK